MFELAYLLVYFRFLHGQLFLHYFSLDLVHHFFLLQLVLHLDNLNSRSISAVVGAVDGLHICYDIYSFLSD